MMKRKQIERTTVCATDRLYGTIAEAIAYLREMQKALPEGAGLRENWTGYENMEMQFVWRSEETDDEFDARLRREAFQAKLAKERLDRDAAKEKRRKEWEALNKEFGR